MVFDQFNKLSVATRTQIKGLTAYDPREYPPCVYFLILKDEIIYVGQTTNLPTRIAQHRNSKDFDYVLWFRVAMDSLKFVEADLIAELRPKLNIVGNTVTPRTRQKKDVDTDKETPLPDRVVSLLNARRNGYSENALAIKLQTGPREIARVLKELKMEGRVKTRRHRETGLRVWQVLRTVAPNW